MWRIILSIASYLGPFFILLLGRTLRVSFIGGENIKRNANENVIYTFWHGRMLLLSYTHRFKGVNILISKSRDGELIAQIVKRLGFIPVRGSTSSGGTEAIFKMSEKGIRGADLAITPDGPRGPAFRFGSGAIILAQRTGMKIVPISCCAKKKAILSSWDSFLIPFPYSQCIVKYGKPLEIKEGLSEEELEAKRKEAEEELRKITEEVDRLYL